MEIITTKTSQLQDFLEFVYGENEGYVYSPTKDANNGTWTQYFFQWPKDKESILYHIRSRRENDEVYYSPCLYRTPVADKENFKLTNVVWAEFDGTLPSDLNGLKVPEPSLKIRSSTPGREHWYWKLDFIIPDIPVLELITKRLTYHLGADLSGWNCNKVLRPPETINHKRKSKVYVISKTTDTVTPQDFISLPELPADLENFKIGTVPKWIDVVAKYKFKKEDWEFFGKASQPEGSRSSALTRLGHTCIEMGMNNAETLSLLTHADTRWKKYQSRGEEEQRIRLTEIIKSCRATNKSAKIVKDILPGSLKVFSLKEFLELPKEIEWIVKGYFQRKGSFLIASPPGLGKTQFSLRLAINMALGTNFLNWKIEKPQKVMFLSLEMPHEGLREFIQPMLKGYSKEEIEKLYEMFSIIPQEQPLRLDQLEDQDFLAKTIDRHRPDGIFIDSLGQSIGDDITSDKVVKDMYRFIKDKVSNSGAFTWFIHHNRKSQTGNRKPKSLDDIYGSRYITTNADTVLMLWKVGNEIELSAPKTRYAPAPEPVVIRRTSSLDFKISRVVGAPKKPILDTKVEDDEVNDDINWSF